MTSEAQKRASAKYEANSVKRIVFKMYPADEDIYKFLKSKQNTNDYLRQLIRRDMERQMIKMGNIAEPCCWKDEKDRPDSFFDCYWSKVNENNQWCGSDRCWNAGCLEAEKRAKEASNNQQ